MQGHPGSRVPREPGRAGNVLAAPARAGALGRLHPGLPGHPFQPGCGSVRASLRHGLGLWTRMALGRGPAPPTVGWPLFGCPEPPRVRRAVALLQSGSLCRDGADLGPPMLLGIWQEGGAAWPETASNPSVMGTQGWGELSDPSAFFSKKILYFWMKFKSNPKSISLQRRKKEMPTRSPRPPRVCPSCS